MKSISNPRLTGIKIHAAYGSGRGYPPRFSAISKKKYPVVTGYLMTNRLKQKTSIHFSVARSLCGMYGCLYFRVELP
jgi:hypothetical protein